MAEQTNVDTSVVHYADEDRNLQPLCGGGKEGDFMTFFGHETTCSDCKAAF